MSQGSKIAVRPTSATSRSLALASTTVFGASFGGLEDVLRCTDIPVSGSNASETVRNCEMNGMKPSAEDNVNRAEKHDRPDEDEPQLVPPDLDLGEGDEAKGDEAKKEGTELPPAMPPKV
jgi:hypothetical protein